MKNILKVFSPFLSYGRIYGFYPFRFTHDGRAEITILRAFHSILMIFFFSTMFAFFAIGAVVLQGQGSDLSIISSIFSAFFIAIIAVLIILSNLFHYRYFETLIKSFWNVDMKVTFRYFYVTECIIISIEIVFKIKLFFIYF